MTQISKNLMCICMHNGAQLWVERERAAALQAILEKSTGHVFVGLKIRPSTPRMSLDFIKMILDKIMPQPPMKKTYSMRKLYGIAYQWIEHRQQHGMDEAEANKLAPVLLNFFEFVMKQKEKASKKHVKT
jgi:hypothetical protein